MVIDPTRMYSTPFYKRLLRRFGIEIKRFHFGQDPWADLVTLLHGRRGATLFDVGANVGQTCLQLAAFFPNASIHAFEPNPEIFERLASNISRSPSISAWNMALGDAPGRLPLKVTGSSLNTSLLSYSRVDGSDRVIREVEAPVETLDYFCAARGIQSIDLLKCDAQGFDLKVFRGGEKLFRDRLVDAVFCEVMFREIYAGQCYFEDIHACMNEHGFKFCGFYDIVREGEFRIHWADALYILPERFTGIVT